MLTIDLDTARRYILGKQGLWPGRRWRGLQGTEQAMRAMEYLQLDPLQIIARSQDITLHSRVLDYTPGMWEALAYQQRKFFDWGGWLAVRPMDELPYWRVVMRREREGHPQQARTPHSHLRRPALDPADGSAAGPSHADQAHQEHPHDDEKRSDDLPDVLLERVRHDGSGHEAVNEQRADGHVGDGESLIEGTAPAVAS